MKLDFTVINSYMNQSTFPKNYEDIYIYTDGRREVQTNRQEVCIALCEELKAYKQFPLWNKDVYQTLFEHKLNYVEDFTILPIIGANEKFDCEICKYHDAFVLMIDLLNIADYTQILEEMKYILHNQIHLKLTKYVLLQMYPTPTTYKDIVQHHYFVDGCSYFVSWKDGLNNVFIDDKHTYQKQLSASLYKKAYHNLNPEVQKKVLSSFHQSDIWSDLVLCAGLYRFADAYNKGKGKDLLSLFLQGPYVQVE